MLPIINLADLATGARRAEHAGDWAAALGYWENIRLLFPDDPAGALGVGIALQQLGHMCRAETILTDAVARFPGIHSLLIEHARVAHRREDWTTAFERWNTIRTQWPNHPEAAAGAGTALQLLNRLDEADAILESAGIRFPTHDQIAVEYARVAMRRNDWSQALDRWQQMTERFPGHPDAVAGLGTSLQILGRLAEAERCLAEGLVRFPNHADIAIEYARVAHRQSDWPEAYRRWQMVMERFPDHADGFAGASVALQMQRRHAELEPLLSHAVQRFPTREDLAIDYARAAHDRGDWAASCRRWESASHQFPGNQAILDGLNSTSFEANLAAIDQGGADPAAPIPSKRHPGRGADLTPTEIMFQFESLGSGCEFGLVQRHFGAEPLGMLRWGAIPALSLVRALESRFEGLGDPERIELFEFGNSKEYFFRDTHYMLEMHTFVRAAEATYDHVFAQQVRRSAFLKTKLLADLDSDPQDAKIFVYKQHTGRIPDSEALALNHAIRRYGDHALLCTRPAEDGHPGGTIEHRAQGLMIGYVDDLSPTSDTQEIRYDSWLKLCTVAVRHWKSLAPLSI